jgi:hypothetical protein
MIFNCYYPDGYKGYIRNGTPTLPPLGQFSQLPWELQEDIIKQAVGPNIPKSLAQMERLSHEWRNYVVSTLWPHFIEKQFDNKTIEMVQELLTSIGQETTPKNIYRLLSAPHLLATMGPSMPYIDIPIQINTSFKIYVINKGINMVVLGKRGSVLQYIPGRKIYLSKTTFVPGNYHFYLSCYGSSITSPRICNAYIGKITV